MAQGEQPTRRGKPGSRAHAAGSALHHHGHDHGHKMLARRERPLRLCLRGQSAAGQPSPPPPRRSVHSATESTSAWRGKTFAVSTRWTSSSASAHASLNTVSS